MRTSSRYPSILQRNEPAIPVDLRDTGYDFPIADVPDRVRQGKGDGVKIAMVSEHASPLAALGGVDAGGQNVHVAALATEMGRQGAHVTVHTRRDDPCLPQRVRLAPGAVVDHVPAGPAAPIPKDELLPHMDAFAADLAAQWREDRPDIVHAHFWMSGHAALMAAR